MEFGPTHIFTQIYAPDNEEGMGQTDKQTDGRIGRRFTALLNAPHWRGIMGSQQYRDVWSVQCV